jgi:type IV secretory pathway VirB3-like protein
MEEVRRAAFQSISRGCGFAGFAIACVVVALSFEPILAARTGGILMTLMTIVLLLKARWALTQDYRDTEAWMLLDREQRPAKQFAQWATATALRESYFRFAQYSAAVAVAFWVVALSLSLAQSVLGGSPGSLSGQAVL